MHVVLPLFPRLHQEERGLECGGQTSAADQSLELEIVVPPPEDFGGDRFETAEGAGPGLLPGQLELVGPPELEDWLERGPGLVPMHVADEVVGRLVVAAHE